MFRLTSLLILLVLAAGKLSARQPSLPVFEINRDSAAYAKLPARYWQFFADPSKKLTLQQAMVKHFQQAKTDSISLSPTDGQVFWLSYGFKNNLSRPVRLVLKREMTRVDIYITYSNGTVVQKTTGNDVPWSRLSGIKQFFEIVVIVPAREIIHITERRTIESFTDNEMLQASFRLGNDPPGRLQDYYDKLGFDNSYKSVTSGLILLAAIVSLFFYAVSRERLYLWFFLFSFTYAVCTAGAIIFDTYLREYPHVNRYFMPALMFSFAFFWQFLSVFYQLPEYYRRWHRGNQILIAIILAGIVAQLYGLLAIRPIQYFMRVVLISFVLSTIPSFFIGIFRRGAGRRNRVITAMPFLSSCILYLGFAMAEAFVQFRPALQSQLEELAGWVSAACLYWLIISFLWNLIRRFQQLQQRVLHEALERESLAHMAEAEKAMLIASQKAELEKQVRERTAELAQSLDELKRTQGQLIQSEKMASLGELTAGIAHEIQNPLNFVNNFSELSLEIAAELEEEIAAGNQENVLDLTSDLKQNLGKINHHGRRADEIVKSMLEHSRPASGQRVLTDLNLLAQEHLSLAYESMGLKKQSLQQVDLTAQLDESLPQINLVPQDIGRVFQNLFNNALYAVRQKQQTASAAYRPSVGVRTFRTLSGGWGAVVYDNGGGIPEAIKDKIMQPFFTTKPPGQGTGLGLYLSYDIIKGLGGSIAVKSSVEEGTSFILEIPEQ